MPISAPLQKVSTWYSITFGLVLAVMLCAPGAPAMMCEALFEEAKAANLVLSW